LQHRPQRHEQVERLVLQKHVLARRYAADARDAERTALVSVLINYRT
jgi:hypothetical protein